ncbi:50S ribosomal protein L35 [Blattabacterium sp. (Blattella germanica) str. Bge]|uniref:50S ribosomal protein L35 n=1 Tax=Blattabacterium sp. (Blattella germanica) TaxID=624186 RepID=UPI0001BB620C|nr:50S ribosomal protein L35 [Blattabacterium sp. (Blattella germanica)]ACY40470.1 50S ribosomal protein L35 [Blattabacterium sp. (Blattella germanica) str. Bge]
MTKLKTKSGSKKRFKKNGEWIYKKKHAFKNHLLTKKSKRRKRNLSRFTLLNRSDQQNIKKQI